MGGIIERNKVTYDFDQILLLYQKLISMINLKDNIQYKYHWEALLEILLASIKKHVDNNPKFIVTPRIADLAHNCLRIIKYQEWRSFYQGVSWISMFNSEEMGNIDEDWYRGFQLEKTIFSNALIRALEKLAPYAEYPQHRLKWMEENYPFIVQSAPIRPPVKTTRPLVKMITWYKEEDNEEDHEESRKEVDINLLTNEEEKDDPESLTTIWELIQQMGNSQVIVDDNQSQIEETWEQWLLPIVQDQLQPKNQE